MGVKHWMRCGLLTAAVAAPCWAGESSREGAAVLAQGERMESAPETQPAGPYQPSAGELDEPDAAADGNAGIAGAGPDERVAEEARHFVRAADAPLGQAANGEAAEPEMAFAPEPSAILDFARNLAQSGADLLDGFLALWRRDPGTSRTVAIMVAFLIGGLILARRRRKSGAVRTSGRASGMVRAGRSFAPHPAPDIDLEFPEEFDSASGAVSASCVAPGIDLEFPEESDPVGLKLQLAEAYFDLGDGEGVRYLLEEVLAEGSPEQCRRAATLADRLA